MTVTGESFFTLAFDTFMNDPQYYFVLRYDKDCIEGIKELNEK
jgi:hypothetical protein